MSTLNAADESGGKPANDSSKTTNNTNIFGAANNNADSSLALLQQVQSILLENNDAKAKVMELQNQVATLQKEREEWICKSEEDQKSSQQTIQKIEQQLSQKEEEWTERYETQETSHKSDLNMLQNKLDDWESQHHDWTTQENEYQQNISNLEESKTRLETNLEELEEALEASKTEATQLQKEQADAYKAHEENVNELKLQIESLQNDQVTQELQQLQDQQSYDEQKHELEKTLDELRASVQEKDTHLQSLERTIEELRLEASQVKENHQTQVQDLEATIGNLEQENVAQSEQAEEYQSQIEKLEQEMDSLNSVFLEQQKQAEQKEKEEEEEKRKQEEEQQRQEEQEDSSKWQDLVQSLQIQVQAQTNIAETKSQELEDSKSQNMQLRVQLQVLTQQKDQLERNWTETKEQLKVLEDRPVTQSNDVEEMTKDGVPQDQQVNQDQAVTSLKEENDRLNERIVQMEAQLVLGGARGLDRSDDGNNNSENNNNNTNDDTIAQLQQRIMHLVEEKLVLQTAVETLEHQFMESDASSRQVQQEKRSPSMTMKEYWHSRQLQLQQLQQQPEPPKIVVDENTDQADIIRQTLEHQKSQRLSRRISKTVLGATPISKPVQQIDVKATERLFLERQQQQQESLKNGTQKGGKETNLSNARSALTTEIGRSSWIRSRDHGMTSQENTTPSKNNNSASADLPAGSTESNQQGLTQPSAMRSSSSSSAKKKEKTTTWTRIRDSISGPKSGESETKTEPAEVDNFSLWVQELNREQQSQEAQESPKQLEEFKSLSEPASMLDSLPASSSDPLASIAGRYAVQTIDDLLKGGADATLDGLKSKQDHKKQETRAKQTYRVADPKYKKVSKEDAAAMGGGQAIDQSNLIGFYVNKQKEAANSTTMGYLSNMIYGDPDEEENKVQQKLLKRQIARKKKQEAKERAQLKKEVQNSVVNKPQTIFSSFI